jgi:hypothetical protein
MPNYDQLTGKDKELATKWMNELVDAATDEDLAKARQEELKVKLSKLFGEPFDVVNINGGKVTGNLITPSTTSGAAIKEVTEGLPEDVLEALQQTSVSISADALKQLGQHASEKIRGFVGVIQGKIDNYKKRQIDAAKAKADGSHVKISVTGRKS